MTEIVLANLSDLTNFGFSLTGDVTGSLVGGLGGTVITTISAGAVTGTKIANTTITNANLVANTINYTSIQQVTASKLLGNPTGGTANISEISLGATLTFSGASLQTLALSGDVTTGTNSFSTTIAAGAVTLAKMANLAANSVIGNNTGSSATPIALTATQLKALTNTAPNVQSFTSGSGTYTTPTDTFGNRPLYLHVKAVGGGGGSGGTGTSGGATSGGAGGNTTFGSSLITASGGGGGGANGTAGPSGLATGGNIFNIPGTNGGTASGGVTGALPGAPSGISFFGGGGQQTPTGGNIGIAGTPNTGGGASGGSTISTTDGGGGGAGGGYVESIITSPAASYSYAVGAAGTAGTAGTSGIAGAAGGSGYLVVEAYWQ